MLSPSTRRSRPTSGRPREQRRPAVPRAGPLAGGAKFVRAWHRHHQPPAGQIFAVGAADEMGTLRAVAIVGRPVARHLDDGATLEDTRTASDGTRNTNSQLYGASWRATKALGYRRLITFTQEGESGASLRGAGWRVIASRPPRAGWHTPSRPGRPATETAMLPAPCGRPPDRARSNDATFRPTSRCPVPPTHPESPCTPLT
ncbi:XF1762 family protein [Streptomyces anulatus]|uniref:XF1762 family protein n=1 Tax=Streptomyces anulatus TaxID=1892 RepID=UPI0030B97591